MRRSVRAAAASPPAPFRTARRSTRRGRSRRARTISCPPPMARLRDGCGGAGGVYTLAPGSRDSVDHVGGTPPHLVVFGQVAGGLRVRQRLVVLLLAPEHARRAQMVVG